MISFIIVGTMVGELIGGALITLLAFFPTVYAMLVRRWNPTRILGVLILNIVVVSGRLDLGVHI